MKTTLIVIGVLVLLAFAALAASSYFSRGNPPALGLNNGALKACGERPNCVSSQASDEAHRVAALAYSGARGDTQTRLSALLDADPSVQFVERREDYWHVTYRSSLFRFIDDVEFFFDDTSAQVHVRSASRVGYSDRGVNRKRIESIRERLK